MKISILTICFNSEAYIERAIQSVLQQDYIDWEHIVVDGGSTDGTVEILKKYDHLKWLSEPDKGQSDAMNKAFNLSSGAIISYLNSDDYYNAGVLSEVLRLFEGSASPEVVIGRLKIIWNKEISFREPIDKYKFISHFWLNQFPANPVSYFYKREVQAQIGEFPVDNHNTMDYWFLLRAFRNRRISKTATEFGIFDLHADTKTFSSLTNNSLNDKLLLDYLEYSKTLPLHERLTFLYPWYKLKYSKLFAAYYPRYKAKAKRVLLNKILHVR